MPCRLRLPVRRFAVVASAAAVVLPATAAWAPHVPQFNVDPAQARPGQEVTVAGTRGYGFTNPVEVRFDSPEGPVLGSFQPTKEGYAAWGPGTIVIPADTAPGRHTLYATQQLEAFEDHIRGIPAKAVIEVVGPGGAPLAGESLAPTGEEGAADLVKSDGESVLPLVLTGLGVAALALLVGGAVALSNARRRSPEAEVVRPR